MNKLETFLLKYGCLASYMEQRGNVHVVDSSSIASMKNWGETIEGSVFWEKIHHEWVDQYNKVEEPPVKDKKSGAITSKVKIKFLFFKRLFWRIRFRKIKFMQFTLAAEGRCVRCHGSNYKGPGGTFELIKTDCGSVGCPCKWNEQLKFKKIFEPKIK